jgi:hypothetical protein
MVKGGSAEVVGRLQIDCWAGIKKVSDCHREPHLPGGALSYRRGKKEGVNVHFIMRLYTLVSRIIFLMHWLKTPTRIGLLKNVEVYNYEAS